MFAGGRGGDARGEEEEEEEASSFEERVAKCVRAVLAATGLDPANPNINTLVWYCPHVSHAALEVLDAFEYVIIEDKNADASGPRGTLKPSQRHRSPAAQRA